MSEHDRCLVMAELDALRKQVASARQKFEAIDFTVILKGDYVALHELEHRITEMYLAHARAIESNYAHGYELHAVRCK